MSSSSSHKSRHHSRRSRHSSGSGSHHRHRSRSRDVIAGIELVGKHQKIDFDRARRQVFEDEIARSELSRKVLDIQMEKVRLDTELKLLGLQAAEQTGLKKHMIRALATYQRLQLIHLAKYGKLVSHDKADMNKLLGETIHYYKQKENPFQSMKVISDGVMVTIADQTKDILPSAFDVLPNPLHSHFQSTRFRAPAVMHWDETFVGTPDGHQVVQAFRAAKVAEAGARARGAAGMYVVRGAPDLTTKWIGKVHKGQQVADAKMITKGGRPMIALYDAAGVEFGVVELTDEPQ